jgi:hypothetical protein
MLPGEALQVLPGPCLDGPQLNSSALGRLFGRSSLQLSACDINTFPSRQVQRRPA